MLTVRTSVGMNYFYMFRKQSGEPLSALFYGIAELLFFKSRNNFKASSVFIFNNRV